MFSAFGKSILGTALFCLGLSLPAFANDTSEALETVPYVDVTRYLGKWYEIAKLPQLTQAGCKAVTAEYSLNDDGSVKVVNTCRLFDAINGQRITITGSAVPVDASNSKLIVSFSRFLPKGNYWVLELASDYSYALIGDPNRRSLFVLSRTPQLDENILQDLLELAASKHGYDVSKVQRTTQPSLP